MFENTFDMQPNLDREEEIDALKNQVQRLTQEYYSALKQDTLKTEFFSNISHDLKTPLSVILGAIQLMEQSILPEDINNKYSRYHKTIKQNCYKLIRLINNILDVTKIDAGASRFVPTNCNIVYLIEEIVQSVSTFAEQKGVQMEFDTEAEEIITSVDMDKIERVILNLLSNAIRFTPAGGMVSVKLEIKKQEIWIKVKDTGPGIPLHLQSTIFDRFKQVGSGLSKDHEGSGIGLALVKSFIEQHSGTIHLRSDLNQGSEFIFTLPIKQEIADFDSPIEIPKMQSRLIEAINIEFSDIYTLPLNGCPQSS